MEKSTYQHNYKNILSNNIPHETLCKIEIRLG